MLWSGTIGAITSDPAKQVNGLLLGKPGKYDNPLGEGQATIVVAGAGSDAPKWSSGNFAINQDFKSGSVDLVFGSSPNQLALKGSFACS